MRSILAILLVVAYCEARPNFELVPVAALSPESYIIGGVNANPGEFPWQLSQQRLGTTWSHSCGASLLGASRALSAAHFLDGAAAANIRVIAGLHDRSNEAGSITSNCASYVNHGSYNTGPNTFSNDIAIIRLATAIAANGGTIQYATLPAAGNDFAGSIATLSGWGRTSASNVLPNVLQKVDIAVISTADCTTRMAPVSGATVNANVICFYSGTQGSCNGDSGGPANLNRQVIGVTSWGISSGGACASNYPSVYTRTSAYLDWIGQN